jgi:hypothetical protein
MHGDDYPPPASSGGLRTLLSEAMARFRAMLLFLIEVFQIPHLSAITSRLT